MGKTETCFGQSLLQDTPVVLAVGLGDNDALDNDDDEAPELRIL